MDATRISLAHAYGDCHSLTAACLALAPAGEALGLHVDGECLHSAFRVPHTAVFVDAFGAEAGTEALAAKAARYVRAGDAFQWLPLSADAVFRMIRGDEKRAIRKARKLASCLLAKADDLSAAQLCT